MWRRQILGGLLACGGVVAFLAALVMIPRVRIPAESRNPDLENFRRQLDARGISIDRFDADYPESFECPDPLGPLEHLIGERDRKQLPTYNLQMDVSQARSAMQSLCKEWPPFRQKIKDYSAALRADAEQVFEPLAGQGSAHRSETEQQLVTRFEELSRTAKLQLEACPNVIRGWLEDIGAQARIIAAELTKEENPRKTLRRRPLRKVVEDAEKSWSEFCTVPGIAPTRKWGADRPPGLWYDLQLFAQAHPIGSALLLGALGSGLLGWCVIPLFQSKNFPEDLRKSILLSLVAAIVAFGLLQLVLAPIPVFRRAQAYVILFGCLAAAIYAERLWEGLRRRLALRH